MGLFPFDHYTRVVICNDVQYIIHMETKSMKGSHIA